MLRRAAGCLVGLTVVPAAVAAAAAGYPLRERAADGRWGAALGWAVAAFVLGVIALALTGLARQLLGSRETFSSATPKEPPRS